MYKINFYVPESHLEIVKNALFLHGAGRIGEYDCCSWQTLGTGQFRPSERSKPFTGQPLEVNEVAEYLVEMVCEDNCLNEVLQALHNSHPYEQPAYAAWPIEQ